MKDKLLLLSSIIAAVSIVSALLVYNNLSFSLISPLFVQNTPPDLTPKLSSKLSTPPTLSHPPTTSLKTVPESVAYLLYNPISGQVYASNKDTEKISPASFTKLVTAVTALDLAPVTQLISATKESINKEPTILGLKEGEQLTVTELINAAIATSANDAAATLGFGIANIYGQDLNFFVTQMNTKVSLMSMNDTHFVNPEGYDDDNQYSTLADLVKVIHNVQQNYPEILNAGKSDRVDLMATNTHGFYYLPNWNGLLGIYPGVNGLKIAYTERAGYGTIITANRNDVPVNLILSGAKTLKERDLYASVLLDHAYAQESLPKVNLTEEQIQARYDTWNDLAKQIRAELEALK